MSTAMPLLRTWLLLTLASLLAGFAGVFCAYAVDGSCSLPAAFGFAWPVGLISGGIGALVLAGPILTACSGWEVFLLGAPNEFNLTVFFFSLPSTLAVAILTGARLLERAVGRDLRVWPLTLCLTPLAYAALTSLGNRVSLS
ncbi:hypothetical protein [Ovoidimarina sediminis]|uniref:hypothetical protein n=1 Tax=Ovoidimarina sediminis TaxID=3079856 RepID=UPI00290B3E24|nr:hypothetical protein [Rhodophyticola sp. MJ-SS7]MDU8941879.1 hypothetical protein [Rhodophyticola sp. MJ-SS7]